MLVLDEEDDEDDDTEDAAGALFPPSADMLHVMVCDSGSVKRRSFRVFPFFNVVPGCTASRRLAPEEAHFLSRGEISELTGKGQQSGGGNPNLACSKKTFLLAHS